VVGMDIRDLKEEILNREIISDILSEIGCHCIQDRGEYITCANKNGDNSRAIVVYKNEYISCTNYTRQITKNGRAADIFDLIAYTEDCSFAEAMKFVCNIAGIDYYGENRELPESLQIIKLLKSMSVGDDEEDDSPVKPISEKVLDYYIDAGNVLFIDDGISLDTQKEWEVKYDPQTNSVCIPIRDELGNLIAVKARRFKYTPNTPLEQRRFPDELGEDESKYFFLEPGAKSQVLYGLYKNEKAIQQQGIVYVGESEKFTLQLYEMGYYGVSTGGSKVSKRQIEMLTRLGVKICFCFDKDISEEDLYNITKGFMTGIPIYAIIDRDDILDNKQSPSDNVCKWNYLIKNNIYQIK
jgi:DNA primase